MGEGGLVRPSSNRPVVVEVTGYLPTNKLAAGPQYLESFYQANPHFATAARQTNRAVPWQGYRAAIPSGSGGRSAKSAEPLGICSDTSVNLGLS